MKKLLILFLVVIFAFTIFLVYDSFAFTNVLVKFDELEPFEKQMNVYFRGFKVGKTTKIFPNEDYTNTYLKLKLKAKKANFPKNIQVNIRKKKTGGYVDIEYPDEPSLVKLKNNDEIKGLITKDISSLLEDENLQDIIDDAGSLVENATIAVQNLNGIFLDVRNIISDNRSNINLIVKNLVDVSSNFNNISNQLNISFSGDEIPNSLANINDTTSNIKEITSQIDETTIPMVNRILCEAYSTSKNASVITGGVKNTLKKRMGLSRLLFGTPISHDCY